MRTSEMTASTAPSRSRLRSSSRWLIPAALGTVLLALVSAGCRQDMHNQPKYIPLRPSQFYADGRSSRPVVEGTVARGDLRADEAFFTGKRGGKPVDVIPVPVTRQLLVRGQDRFNIFCSPCHDRLGNGLGMVVRRGFRQPPSYHTDRLRELPVGYFYDVMTNGFGAMQDYAAQVPPADRWAIAAYIRVLQYSQHANAAEVPEVKR